MAHGLYLYIIFIDCLKKSQLSAGFTYDVRFEMHPNTPGDSYSKLSNIFKSVGIESKFDKSES